MCINAGDTTINHNWRVRVTLKKLYVQNKEVDILNDINFLVSINDNDIIFENKNDSFLWTVNQSDIINSKISIKVIDQSESIEIYQWEKCLNYFYVNSSNNYIFYFKNNTNKDGNYITFLICFNNDNFTTSLLSKDNLILLSSEIELFQCHFNFFKIEKLFQNNSSQDNEVSSFYFKIVYTSNFYFTSRQYYYLNKSKEININCCVSLKLPKIDFINNILVLFYVNNEISSYMTFLINDIEKGNYNHIQFKAFPSLSDSFYIHNLMFNIKSDSNCEKENKTITNKISFDEQTLPVNEIENNLTIGKTVIWNIKFQLGEILVLPYNYYGENETLNIFFDLGGHQYKLLNYKIEELKQKNDEINFQYQTVGNSVSELPLLIIRANFSNSKYYYKGILNFIEERQSSFVKLNYYQKKDNKTILNENIISNGIPLIIIKYNSIISNSPIRISLINFGETNNSQTEESFDINAITETQKVESTTSKKSYTIIIHTLQIKHFIPINQKNEILFISVNSSTQEINQLSSSFLYKKLKYQNIRFDITKQDTFPCVSLTLNINHKFYSSVYNLSYFLSNNQPVWVKLENICEIQMFAEIIEYNNSIKKDVCYNEPELDIYQFEFIGLGLRGKYKEDLMNRSNLKINLNQIYYGKNSNSDLCYDSNEIKRKSIQMYIKESISIPYNIKNNNNKDIMLSGELYIKDYLDKENYLGKIIFEINKIIEKTQNETDANLQLINKKCSTGLIENDICEINRQGDIQIEIKDNSKENIDDIVVYPKTTEYKLDEGNSQYKVFSIEDLSNIPNVAEYKVVSYNNSKFKHYRKYFNYPLEDQRALGLVSPFMKLKVNGLCEEYYKCLIRIPQEEQFKQYKSVIQSIENKFSIVDFNKEFSFLSSFDNLQKSLCESKEVILQLYFCEIRLDDNLNLTNPCYIKIKINSEKSYTFEEINKVIEIPLILPGNNQLSVELWEKGGYDEDKLIGVTNEINSIDLEDRFYNSKWIELLNKPIEKITINKKGKYNKEIACQLYLWIDIIDKTFYNTKNEEKIEQSITEVNSFLEKKSNKWNIDPIKFSSVIERDKYQIRIIAYEAIYIDLNKKTSQNFYISSTINTDKEQKQFTDIHYDCVDNNSFFNWRFIFNSSQKENNIYFTLCNYNTTNEELCNGTIEITPIVEIIQNISLPVQFTQSLYKTFANQSKDIEFISNNVLWLNLFGGNVLKGKIKISIEVLPLSIANQWKVGKGRDSPNINPYLIYPYERIKWRSNPFRMLSSLINRSVRKKILRLVCCTIIIFYFIFLIPYIIYHLAGQAVNPWNYVYINHINKNK